ncbi:hypothetical protein ACJIZ3_020641 [Penstemon smallii]|uniref:Two-component response regulator n=1 Tax=Penstemon smallii TaxID=265156 RepID=A0ABD3SJ70_9LAMI
MTVGEFRVDKENYDNFPVGMRVLAVDDDLICLKLLETMLSKCQYEVTATSEARVALNMLRENKDRFDLVISDVHMPDMDGFKLLELVGLEMDLPVIMLSANNDAKLVMKGVSHGACDYLVKPVRLEELGNIWQHVIRRKKSGSRKQNNQSVDKGKDNQTSGEVNGSPSTVNRDLQNGKCNRKRKEDEDEGEDNGNDSDDPATQKKPRVVWSVELHRKFVAAVNQLGYEKEAVPKKILDLMNVGGLTRENVASHLQKYRLYLKKLPQQANMAAPLGVRDTAFMRLGSLDGGLRDYRTLAGLGRLRNTALSSSPYTMLGRLNSPANINLHNITHPSHTHQNTALARMHPVLSPSSQNPSLFQGTPSSFDASINDSGIFTGANAFTDTSNFLNSTQQSSMMLQGNSAGFRNQSSQNMASFNQEPSNGGSIIGSSNLMEPNSLLSTEPFMNSARENNLTNGHYLVNNSIENMALVSLEDARGNVNERLGGERGQNYGHTPSNNSNMFGSINTTTTHVPSNNGIVSPFNRRLDQNIGILNQKMDMFLNGGSTPMQQINDNGTSVIESRARSNENLFLEQHKLQGGFAPQNYDSLDDLVNAVFKRGDETTPNFDCGLDEFSFGQDL